MTATPTPGDLSARLLAESQRRESEWAHIPTNNPRSKFVHDERLRELLREAAAALSALPAAGGAKPRPVAWYVFAGTEHWVTHDEDEAEGNRAGGCEVRPLIFGDTTPQPSAADDYESWAKQERQREDTATRLGSAAVGAQGDGDAVEHAVDRFLAWPLPKDFGPDCGISFTPLGHPNGWPSGTNLLTAAQAKAMFQHCLATPAAGKGVDEVLAKLHGLARSINNEDVCHLNASADMLAILQEARFGRNRLEAALTRQPVAGDRLRIEAQPGLDPISVYFEDYAPGSGRMTVACCGEAWTAAWGAMGDRTVRQFVAEIVDEGYLSGAMLSLCGPTRRNREYATKVARAVIAALAAPAGTPAIAAITGGES